MADQQNRPTVEKKDETVGFPDVTTSGAPLAIGLWFLIPGIIQGIALYFIFEFAETKISVPAIAAAFFFTIAPVAYYLTTSKRTRLSAFAFAGALGVLTAALYFMAQTIYGTHEPAPLVVGVSLVANTILSYIAVPFFRTMVERRQSLANYSSLYEFA